MYAKNRHELNRSKPPGAARCQSLFIHTYIHTRTHTHTHTHKLIHTCICTRMHAYTHVHKLARMHTSGVKIVPRSTCCPTPPGAHRRVPSTISLHRLVLHAWICVNSAENHMMPVYTAECYSRGHLRKRRHGKCTITLAYSHNMQTRARDRPWSFPKAPSSLLESSAAPHMRVWLEIITAHYFGMSPVR
jgi:hypothetical protein